jgi:hypothetical protein
LLAIACSGCGALLGGDEGLPADDGGDAGEDTLADAPGVDGGADVPGDKQAPTDSGAPPGDGGADASGADSGIVADTGSPDVGADTGCPGTAGPTPVQAGSICIDSTEVTNDQYAQFLTAGVSLAGQPAVCSWNTTYVQSVSPAANTGDFPVAYVDWCDAYAFCKWAGKRLCGRIGGGSVTPGAGQSNAGVDQWYYACSQAGARVYPYSNNFVQGACRAPACEHA